MEDTNITSGFYMHLHKGTCKTYMCARKKEEAIAATAQNRIQGQTGPQCEILSQKNQLSAQSCRDFFGFRNSVSSRSQNSMHHHELTGVLSIRMEGFLGDKAYTRPVLTTLLFPLA